MRNNDLILGIAIGYAAALLLTRRTAAPALDVRNQTTTAVPVPLPAGQLAGYPFRGGVMIAGRKPQRPATYNQLTDPGYPMPGWMAV
jgi:hypothetical protein